MPEIPKWVGGIAVGLAAAGLFGGCRGSGGVPAPIVGDGYTLSLARVSASRSVDFKKLTEKVTVGIAVELDRPDIGAAGPSSHPTLVLHAVHDEDGTSIPIRDTEPRSSSAPAIDLRSFMMLIGSMDTPPQRTVGVGGGGVSGFERMPRSLRLVAGTVEFDRLTSFRTIDVPLAGITESTEVIPGLWLRATVAEPRPREVRVDLTHTVVMSDNGQGAVPPLPAVIELLDQHGGVLGRLHAGSSQASATRVLTDARFVGYLPAEREPSQLRITLGSHMERVKLPFEFRDVPVSLK